MRIATGEADGTVRLWDAATGEETLVLTGHSANVVDVTFGPNGRRLASVSLDGTMRVWAIDIEDLLALARAGIERELTDAECRAHIGFGCTPAVAPERLVPATADWERPYGIDEAAWAGAEIGGLWTEETLGHVGDLVLDPGSYRLFAFNGGPDASWSLDLNTKVWSEAASMPAASGSDEPYAEFGEAVYHSGSGLIITTRLEDGVTMGYDIAADLWSEIAPAEDAFVGRYASGMVYDAGSDRIVLFGGALWGLTDEGKHVGLADTWIFDLATANWTDVTPEQSPPPREYHAMVYDTASHRIIVFGGATRFTGEVLDDTWVYDTDANMWTETHPSVSPPGRAGAAAWYDPGTEATFIFGGAADWSSWPPLPWKMAGGEELWSFDLDSASWTLYRTEPNPGYRLSSQVVFDLEKGEAILVGGDAYDLDRRFLGWLDDAWTYEHAAP
jgi:hypothetical protein